MTSSRQGQSEAPRSDRYPFNYGNSLQRRLLIGLTRREGLSSSPVDLPANSSALRTIRGVVKAVRNTLVAAG
jgi:hypothetical protein